MWRCFFPVSILKGNLVVSFAVEVMVDYFFLDLHKCKKKYLTLSQKKGKVKFIVESVKK